MRRLVWSRLSEAARLEALSRPEGRTDEGVAEAVRSIVEDIRLGGWDEVVRYSRRFDGQPPRRHGCAGPAASALSRLSAEQSGAIGLAVSNIRSFHEGTVPEDHWCEPTGGIRVGKVWRPIDRVGLYVPGGAAPLFSTLLMLALPARIAGVGEIVVATPPDRGGGLDPTIALAAQLCGISEVWTVGGAQAIAALAFGAGDIPKVDKICGPGNAFVAAAKSRVSALANGPAIDLPAGPSELVVIADDRANPSWVAADLLSQAEHDPSAQVLLITPFEQFAIAVEAELRIQAADIPRSGIAATSLASGRIIITRDLDEAIRLSNDYAPEHLSLAIEEADAVVPKIRNAGAIFLGHGASESFGDYLTGPSHVLPTDGAARAWSGISVSSFLKSISVHRLSEQGIAKVAPAAAALARMEGLEAHARAACLRFGSCS